MSLITAGDLLLQEYYSSLTYKELHYEPIDVYQGNYGIVSVSSKYISNYPDLEQERLVSQRIEDFNYYTSTDIYRVDTLRSFLALSHRSKYVSVSEIYDFMAPYETCINSMVNDMDLLRCLIHSSKCMRELGLLEYRRTTDPLPCWKRLMIEIGRISSSYEGMKKIVLPIRNSMIHHSYDVSLYTQDTKVGSVRGVASYTP